MERITGKMNSHMKVPSIKVLNIHKKERLALSLGTKTASKRGIATLDPLRSIAKMERVYTSLQQSRKQLKSSTKWTKK